MADARVDKGKRRPGRNLKASKRSSSGRALAFQVSDAGREESESSIKMREKDLKAYITDTKLETILKKALNSLITRPTFPQNPYRHLIPFVRKKEFGMQIDSEFTLQHNIVDSGSREKGYISQAKGYYNIHGIKEVLGTINLSVMGSLFKALAPLSGVWISFVEGSPETNGGMVEVLSSLVGRCIFYGSSLPYISNLRISHDVVVTTKKQADAMKSFADAVVRNFDELQDGLHGFTRGIYVVQKSRSGGQGIPKLWTRDDIRRSRQEFHRQVQDAVRAKQMIYIDAVAWLKIKPGMFVYGKEGVKESFEREKTFQEEVFSDEDNVEEDGNDIFEGPQHGGFYKVRKEFSMYHFAKAGPGSNGQIFCRHPYSSLAMGVFRSEDEAIRYASLFGFPEFSQKTAETLRGDLCRRLSDLSQDGNWVQMYEVLLMVDHLSQRSVQKDVAQILNSFCGRLRQLSIESNTLSAVMNIVQHHDLMPDAMRAFMEENIKLQFQAFYERIAAMVTGGGLGGNSFFASLKLPLRSLLESIMGAESRKLIFGEATAQKLLDMSQLYRLAEVSLAADAQAILSGPSKFIAKVVANVTDGKPKPKQISFPKQTVFDVTKEAKTAIQNNKYPVTVARESVILQYLCDTRVDSTVKEVYQCLLLEPLYPNPFPRVVKILQEAWARYELQHLTDDKIEKEFSSLSSTPVPRVSPNQRSCYMEKAAAKKQEAVYGAKCALRFMDPGMLGELYDSFPALRNTTDSSMHLKNNTEHICLALARKTAIGSKITGSMQGRLPSFVECHEHYVIEGAVKRSAIRLFVEHVMGYVKWFHGKTPHIVRALGTGDCDDSSMRTMTSLGVNFNVATLKKNIANARRELLKAVGEGKGIAMHAFLKLPVKYKTEKWLYLRKWFVFHWRGSKSDVIQFHSDASPSYVYEEAYFNQTHAEIAMEALLDLNTSKKEFEDPNDENSRLSQKYTNAACIEVARQLKSGKMLAAYHALVPYALVQPEEKYLVLDIVRMLRSPAQELHHLQLENIVLQHMLNGLSLPDPEDSFKGKVTTATLKQQVCNHRHDVLSVLEKIGDAFVTNSSTELNASYSEVEKVVGTSDSAKVEEAIELLQNCHSFMGGLVLSIGNAVHGNSKYTSEVFRACKDHLKQTLQGENDATLRPLQFAGE
jgi:hypothetical protein